MKIKIKEQEIERDEFLLAIVKAYCTKENEHKEMDIILNMAINDEIIALLQVKEEKQSEPKDWKFLEFSAMTDDVIVLGERYNKLVDIVKDLTERVERMEK